jgi:hypothetical protein
MPYLEFSGRLAITTVIFLGYCSHSKGRGIFILKFILFSSSYDFIQLPKFYVPSKNNFS